MERISEELKAEGYDYAVAIATEAGIEAGAACGQLAILVSTDEG
jgi:adenine C2-methylase RlmN of 23S rRNA A2503 and tRNA A37